MAEKHYDQHYHYLINGVRTAYLDPVPEYDNFSIDPNTPEEQERKNLDLGNRLRIERNQLLSATDWWVLPDRTATQAQLDYRQALRDLPTNSPYAALDEQGNLINVTWPTKPEA